MDSSRLPVEVRIECAKDDARVIHGSVPMQTQKMATVVRQENPAFGGSELEDL
jgi:hypothetical protein